MKMLKIKFSFFVVMIMLGFAAAYAQPLPKLSNKPKDYGIKSKKALNYFMEGRQQARWRTMDLAIEAYENALEIEPDFAEAHHGIGTVMVREEQYEEAFAHLKKADALKPGKFGGISFFLAQASFFSEKYAESVPYFEDYLKEGKGGKTYMRTAELNLKKARFAREAIKTPVDFKPQNMGAGINSPTKDYMPCLTADGQSLLFISRRQGSTGGAFRKTKEYPEDFYFTTLDKDGKWGTAKNLGAPINTPENEGAPNISQDGKTLLFTGCNYEGGLGSCDLYISHWDGKAWSKPQNMGPKINSRGWEGHPCLSHDGKELFFLSSRKGGLGGRDIWRSEWKFDEWSEPVNIGAPVNSPGHEDAPFLHADGQSLYFASNYHPGFGNADLFVAYRLPDGGWADPQNLGYPINTSDNEANIFVETKGRRGFINSTRDEGLGETDIYSFELPEQLRPRLATFLRGWVKDSVTHAPVYARIHLLDVETGDTIRDVFTGKSNGKFLMSLPLDREYAALVEAPRYLFASKNFFLKNLDEETFFDVEIELSPLSRGAKITLQNVFFETNSYTLLAASHTELRFLFHYLNQNKNMKVEIQGHTDNVGSDEDNLSLSQKRAEAVRIFLIEKGISADRIKAVGFGEKVPVADNDAEEGRAQNRRTVFLIRSL